MTYTIKSAQWGNEDRTSVIAITEEVAAVALSEVDTPKEWENFLKWAQKNEVAELPTPQARPPSKVELLEARITALETKGVLP